MKANYKSFASIACVAIIGLFASCSKDDVQTHEDYESLIIGKWECYSSYVKWWEFDTSYYDASTGEYIDEYSYHTYIDESERGHYGRIDEYKNDGTVTYSTGQEYTYTISGDKLLIAGGLWRYTIDELTNNSFVLSKTTNGTDHNGDDYTETIRFKYKRIN